MAVFPAIYRAKAVQVNGSSVIASVPQVFAEASIPITAYMGTPPIAPGMGWVMFQGGNPEFPVWVGTATGAEVGGESGTLFITRDYRWSNVVTATDPGHGFVQVNNIDPALAIEVYLSLYDLSETAFLMAKTLRVGDLIAVYITGDIDTRIEYNVSGALTDNGEWLSFPVTVAANYGFRSVVPGNNASVQVVAQVTGHAIPKASQIAFTPVGSIAATNVQAAIAEVASEAATASTAIIPGGVLGDILVKQSAVDSAATWGTSLPRLTLSSTTGFANLTQADTALMLGAAADQNMIFDRNGIQARNNGAAATLFLNELGGTLSLGTPAVSVSAGLMTFPNSNESIRMAAAGGYQSWYDGATRIGYLQGNATQVYLNVERAASTLRLRGAAGLFLDNGTANYQLSESIIGTRVVATNSNGYIFGNYFNMTANVVDSWPGHYAGMAGSDNYLRWYTKVHSSHISGGDLVIEGALRLGMGGNTTQVNSAEKLSSAGGPVALRYDGNTASGNKSWQFQTIILRNQGTSGNELTGISFNNVNSGRAAMLRSEGGEETLGHVNQNNTGYVPVRASAFTVTSTLRQKQEVSNVIVEPLLKRLIDVPLIKYRPKIRPQQLRFDKAGYEAAKRQREGEEIPEGDFWHSYDHDCAIDNCYGTSADPCLIGVNDRAYIGIAAEALAEVLPEAVHFDEEGLPDGYDAASVAAAAFALVGTLARQVADLKAQVELGSGHGAE